MTRPLPGNQDTHPDARATARAERIFSRMPSETRIAREIAATGLGREAAIQSIRLTIFNAATRIANGEHYGAASYGRGGKLDREWDSFLHGEKA